MQQENQDGILLRRAIHEKDRKALGWLYTKYYRRITRFMASCINSVADAEDLAQILFLELCKGNEDYKEYQNAEAYLFGIARNLVGQYRRSKSRQAKTIRIDSVEELAASAEDNQYWMSGGKILPQEHENIQYLVNQLPPKAQQAVKLRFLKGLSPSNAAKKAECSVNTFYQRLNAGVKAVKKVRK